MKKIIMICLCLTIGSVVMAQKVVPEIKAGSTLQATGSSNGRDFSLMLTVKSIVAPVSIGWSVDGYGEGAFEMSAKAVDEGTQFLRVSQPGLGVTKTADNETFNLISKTAYKSLSESKGFTYGGKKYSLKITDSSALQINGKDTDVFHVASEDGQVELWILKGATLPLVVKSVGLSTDIAISGIK
jgi:hypothetical protein